MLLEFSAVLAALAATLTWGGSHTIREGHVGLYYRGGALLDRMADSGLNWKIPILDRHEEVQVTMQTDHVSNIACGTSGGVVINFERVEVVNRLRRDLALETVRNFTVNYDKPWIFDKVHHEINQLCSRKTLRQIAIDEFDQLDESIQDALVRDTARHAPGIEVLSVRVTKPRLPEAIRLQFEAQETEKAKLAVEEQRRKVVQAAAETEKMKQRIEAERAAEVAAVDDARLIAQKQAEQKREEIRNQMSLAAARAAADAVVYQKETEAAANAKLHTPEYLELQKYASIAANTKIYFGERIPTAMLASSSGESLIGGANATPSARG